jgi:hypothetical protein
MAAHLAPLDGNTFLSPAKVVEMLRAHFEFVEVDLERGVEVASDMLMALRQMGADAGLLETITRNLENAVWMSVGDDETNEETCIGFNVIPEMQIFTSADPYQGASALLIERVAAVLGYAVKRL